MNKFWLQSTLSVSIYGANIILALGMAVLAARLLSPEDYSIYFSALAHATILFQFGLSGWHILTVRYTSEYVEAANEHLIPILLNFAKKISFTYGLILIPICVIVFFASKGDAIWWVPFLIQIPSFFFISTCNIYGGVLKGTQNVNQGQLPNQIIRPIVFIVLILLAWKIMESQSATTFSAMYLTAYVCAAITSVLLYKKLVNFGENDTHQSQQISSITKKRWIKSVAPMAITELTLIGNMQLGFIVLEHTGQRDEVSFLQPAMQLSLLALVAGFAVNTVLLPKIRAILDRNKIKSQHLVSQVSAVTCLGAALVTVILYQWGEFIISLSFGPAYIDSYIVAVTLAAGIFIKTTFGSSSVLLNMIDKERLLAKILVSSAALHIACSILLANQFGAMGVALAYSIYLITSESLSAYFFFRETRVRTDIYFFFKRKKS